MDSRKRGDFNSVVESVSGGGGLSRTGWLGGMFRGKLGLWEGFLLRSGNCCMLCSLRILIIVALRGRGEMSYGIRIQTQEKGFRCSFLGTQSIIKVREITGTPKIYPQLVQKNRSKIGKRRYWVGVYGVVQYSRPGFFCETVEELFAGRVGSCRIQSVTNSILTRSLVITTALTLGGSKYCRLPN